MADESIGVDTKINTHLNNVDEIKAGIKKDIETLFDKLNAKSLIKNVVEAPGNTTEVLIFAITEKVVKKYIKPIFKESQRFTKNVLQPDSKKVI